MPTPWEDHLSESLDLRESVSNAIEVLRAHPDELAKLFEVLRKFGVLQERTTSAQLAGLVAVPEPATPGRVELEAVSHARAGGSADLTVELIHGIEAVAPSFTGSAFWNSVKSAAPVVNAVCAVATVALTVLRLYAPDPARIVNNFFIQNNYWPPPNNPATTAVTQQQSQKLSDSAVTVLTVLRDLGLPSRFEDLVPGTRLSVQAIESSLNELESAGMVTQIIPGFFAPTRI